MLQYFRLLAFVYVVYCVVALAPQAGAAAELASRDAASSAKAQHSDESAFSELERRAAAQEGLSDDDRAFLMTAVQAEMLQLELSKVATARARTPAVRRFAGATAQFMRKTASRLDEVATEFGVSLPLTLPDEVENTRIALGKSNDPDREYLTRIVADTTQARDLYKAESGKGKNPVVVQFAREMSPRLAQHHRNAVRLLATTNGRVAETRRSRTTPAPKS
jgi:predicted outer membrane protein